MKFNEIEWAHGDSMPWLKDRIIYLTLHGSRAYGTSSPTSDVDVKGVAVPPAQYFHGFVKQFEQAESKDPDMVIYEVRKFINLAADCNPSIVEVLWTDPADHLLVTPLGELLLDMRDSFLSRKAKHTFSGYAVSQLKRIQRHYAWLKNPPREEPNRKVFGLPEYTPIPADERGRLEAAIKAKMDSWNIDFSDAGPATIIQVQQQVGRYLEDLMVYEQNSPYHVAARSLGVSGDILAVLDRERSYTKAKITWDQYVDWKAKRNPQRAALEEKFGYDTKHAMHLVRLMRMCEEILSTGKVMVKRPDAEELLAIRAGAWTYEELIDWADKKDKRLDETYKTSKLPAKPPRELLDQKCMEIVEKALRSDTFDYWMRPLEP